MKTDPTNLLKGKVAESIIRYMFEASGKKVCFSGIEGHTCFNDDVLNEGVYSEILENYFQIPDFIVQHENGTREFVEVKYRKTGSLEQSDLDKLNHVRNTWKPTIMILSMSDSSIDPNIRVIEPPYTHFCSIEQYDKWSLNPEIVQQCIRLTKSFFAEFSSSWNSKIELLRLCI